MTPTLRHRSLFLALLACAAGASLTARLAQAETEIGVSSLSEAKAMYQHDVSACRNHQLDEDQKTCMLEAQRAYDDAKREALHHGGKATHHHHQGKKPAAEEKPQ